MMALESKKQDHQIDTFSDHETNARARFDEWSVSTTFRRLRPWLAHVQQRLLDEVDWRDVTTVLDVACGHGWAVREAAKRIPNCHNGFAFGCDISEGMLANRTPQDERSYNVCFVAASAQSLPYRDASFDVVFCTAAFHHFPDPCIALRGFHRVLRPGGRLLIADTCRDQSLGTWIWDRLHRWFEKGHVKYYRTDELYDLLQRAGFGSIRRTDLTPTYAQTKKLVRNAALFQATVP